MDNYLKSSDSNINKKKSFNIEKRLMVLKDDFFELLNHFSFDDLIGEINYGNIDQGLVLFDDSATWAYYYGEDLCANGNFEEFDLFIIKKENESSFVESLKDKMLLPYKIQETRLDYLFKDVNSFKNKLFEIKIGEV